MSPDPAAVIERYLAAVTDPDATAADVAAFVHPDARFVEHPNSVAPCGRRRDADAALAALGHSRRLMREHRFDVQDHMVAGDRVVTRAQWSGVLAIDAGDVPAGTELRADCCIVFTVRDGRVVEQQNYDCYHPVEVVAGVA
jgi:ketosteroid isomerase-like protein